MNFVTSKAKALVSGLALMIAGTMASVAIVSAQAPAVVFNNGSGVAGVGEEKDFLRINDVNGPNTTEACSDGQTVNLWFYVHNTNPSELNGPNLDSNTVAKNTKVDLDFKNSGFANSQEIDASVKADNSALATDNAFITCQGKEISLSYVSQSLVTNAPAFTSPYALTGSIMDNATLGYDGGVVPGCFEYRAYITVTVKVNLKPVVKPATCDLLDVTKNGKAVTVNKVNFTANSATVNNVVIDFGNGTTKTLDFNQLPFTYTYPSDNDYTITATLKTSMGDVSPGDQCSTKVKKTVTPTPPTSLPNTGAGGTVAAFLGASFIGAFLYRVRALRGEQ